MLAVARDRLIGLALIVVVAIIWIVASFVVQALVAPGANKRQALPPLVLTYICNSLFLGYLPLSYARCAEKFKANMVRNGWGISVDGDVLRGTPASQHSTVQSADIGSLEVESSPAVAPNGDRINLLNTDNSSAVPSAGSLPSKNSILRAAMAVSPIWFLAQLSFNEALARTSVTSNTILSSPASLFTFLLSIVVLGEHFTYAKLGAVFLTVAGTVCVALADTYADTSSQGQHDGVVGDSLTILAAILYACYTVMLRLLMPKEDEEDMMLFFGYLGLTNIVLFGPICLFLHIVGAYNLWAISSHALGLAALKGLFDNALADYLWSRAVLLIGPTVASVGLSLQVPIAMVLDPLMNAEGWWSHWAECLLELAGACAILSGFLVVTYVS